MSGWHAITKCHIHSPVSTSAEPRTLQCKYVALACLCMFVCVYMGTGRVGKVG